MNQMVINVSWPFTLPFLHAIQLWSDVFYQFHFCTQFNCGHMYFTDSLPKFSVKYVKSTQLMARLF